jgi:putative ABC transport system permease protein
MRAAITLALDDLRARKRAGMVATIAVVAIATVGIVAGLMVARAGERTVDRLARQANVAQVVAYAEPATADALTHDPDVAAASGPYPVARGEAIDGSGTIPIRLTGMDATPPIVSRPLLRSGRWLDRTDRDAVVVEHSVAQHLGLRVGGPLHLRIAERDVALTVVGTAFDFTDCLYPQCDPGRLFAPRALVDSLAGEAGTNQQVLVTVKPSSTPDRLVARWFAQHGDTLAGTDTWHDTRGDFLARDRIFGGFLTAFGGFLLVAAIVIVAGTTTARTTARRRDIAITKALGATPAEITAAFVVEHLILGAVGVLAGWVVGSVVAPFTVVGIAHTLGHGGPTFAMAPLVMAAVLVGALLVVATIVPARRLGHDSTIAALRDEPSAGRRARRGLTERPVLGLAVGSVIARPVRSVLVGLAIVIAVAGAVIGMGFERTMGGAAAHPERTSLAYDVSIDAPDVYTSTIAATLSSTPQVAGWVSRLDRRALIGDRPFLSRAIGGPADGARYPIAAGEPLREAGEAVVGYGLVKQFHLRVGDNVTFSAGGTPLTVRIVGWFRTTEDTGNVLVYRLEQLATADPTAAPTSWFARAEPSTRPQQLADLLGTRLRGATVRPRSTSSGIGPFQIAVTIIGVLIAAVALAHLLAMSIATGREQGRQLGVQRALGFTDRQLGWQHATTAAIIGAGAAIVGVPAGLGLLGLLSDALTTSIGIGPHFVDAPPATQLVAVAIAAALASAVIGWLSARVLLRQRTVDLLRHE